ncbi:sphingolipid long chain base-responsive protein PIL1 [Physcia stellaris]|nr:sphingolipid long chain base-responsive protein PIL1 [Physcia stellaris]
MAIKRKRSSNFSPSDATAFSRDHPFSPTNDSTDEDAPMSDSYHNASVPRYPWTPDASPPSSANSIDKHLHSRTRKRFRNSRPSEETVHENTYSLLFAAARSPTPNVPPRPKPSPIQSASSSSTSTSSQPRTQSSLNAFWQHLPPAPAPTSPPPPPPHTTVPMPRCEDCDLCLYPPSSPPASADVDMSGMDIDTDERESGREFECEGCGRRYRTRYTRYETKISISSIDLLANFIPKSSSRRVLTSSSRQVVKSSSRQVVKSSSRQVVKSSSRQVVKSSSRQVVKSSSRQVVKSSSRQVVKSSSRQVVKSSSRQVVKSSSRQVVKSSSRQVVKSSSRQVVKSSSRQIHLNQSQV